MAVDTTKGMPEVPKLEDQQGAEPPVVKAEVAEVAAPIVIPAEPKGRYWSEDRILRLVLAITFMVFAVGLVVSLARWDVMSHVPFLPWLVGAALLAGPAWRAYEELAEEAKGRRIREEQRKTQYGVSITAPDDLHRG